MDNGQFVHKGVNNLPTVVTQLVVPRKSDTKPVAALYTLK